MSELADGLSSGLSPPSRLSSVTLEKLGPLAEGLSSPESVTLEISERYESSRQTSTASVPEQDGCERQKQLEKWVADLQAEVAGLRECTDRGEHAAQNLLRELPRLWARVQRQDSELKQLQRAAHPCEEEPEVPSPQNQMQALDKRLVEVREALTQIRRRQAQQDAERKEAERGADLRLAEVTGLLRQEEEGREAACKSLEKNQEDTSRRVDLAVAKMQAQVTKLGEEMSLRFLKREAKLCGFLQKSFLALEKRVSAWESRRLQLEGSLWEALENRWQQLQEQMEQRIWALHGQHEECRLLEQCRGLDAAVVQLTEFVRQNQTSLNRVLRAEQKARDAREHSEQSQAGELASYVQENLEAAQQAGELARQETWGALELENLEAAQQAGELARQETWGALELLREKSQALEVSMAELARQVEDLSDHFLALTWRLELQEQTLGLRLSQVKAEWEGAERRALEEPAKWREGVSVCLQELREMVDRFPQQIEAISDRCVLHKSDSDRKVSSEGQARAFEVQAVRQELATLLSSVQQLKEDSSGRKIAELQGRLATVP